MDYHLLAQVPAKPDGEPVKLRLHWREPEDGPRFAAVSWRTALPNGKNRQWYWLSDGGYWTLPFDLAVRRMEEAMRMGLLAEQYDDTFERFGGGKPSYIVSKEC